MSIFLLPSARLHQVLFKLGDDRVNIFLTKANHSSVVDDDIREQGICFLIFINFLNAKTVVFGTTSFVAPLETTHGDNTDNHYR